MRNQRDRARHLSRAPRTPRLIAALLLLAGLHVQAQLEPCGLFEIDGKPGYGLVDLRAAARHWREDGSYPTVPDYNGDGRVDVRDLARQAGCVPRLAPGLVGSYYGFNTGDPEQTLSFPDFDALGFEPTTVKIAADLEEFQGWRGFLNSDMLELFGARYDGYLMVPESAVYTLQISGREGMRVILDGNEILSFDGSPRNDSATLALDYGLHSLRIDYYTEANGSVSFTWSSNGTVIGGTNVLVGPDYLMHDPASVPEHTVTDIEVRFDPPSGTRVTTGTPRIQAWLLGPGDGMALNLKGNKVLYDGKMDQTVQLTAGLNAIPYTVTDSDGRSVSGIYNLYWDAVPAMQPGLNVNVFVDEWYDGVVPATTDLEPVRHFISDSTQMQRDGNGRLYLDNQYVPGNTIVEMVGVIRILDPGTYNFRIADGSGALFINGEEIAAIGNDYPNQWVNNGSLYLDAGRHHYKVRVGRPWESPAMRVFWTPPGAGEALVPDSKFLYNTAETRTPPDYAGSVATGGRSRVDQMAEYVFDPAAPFADTSGNGYHLPFDGSAIPRAGGGLTYQTPGGTSSLPLGAQLVQRIKDGDSFSLEVDFVHDDIMDWHERRLISLSAPWEPLVKLFVQYDGVYFQMFDDADGSEIAEVPGILSPGGRYHVVATYNGAGMSVWVNGVQQITRAYSPSTALWPAMASLDVGQPWFRRNYPDTWGYQLKGSILVAAAYHTRLGSGGVTTNRNANLSINPTPGPLVHAAAPQFPPAGTTQADFDQAVHVLKRLSFGPSPQSLTQLLDMGLNAWIDQQLDPQSIDDGALEAELASGIFIPTKYVRDLQGETTYRMARSNRQLQEVITQFWENHFNTQVSKTGDLTEELAENNRFRALAFGDFEDLLLASAMHYPMTVYLDSDTNVVGAANENYAREILELHTYGVNNGYTQTDIEEVARCFTGWTIREGRFYFNPGLHDYGPKNMLGLSLPAGGGLSDGMAVIAHVAASPNTADFLSWKLCQLLVDDDPPADVQSAAATAFTSNGGNIEQVLRAIFNHARFRTDTTYRDNKIKSPLEFGLSLLRAAEIPASGNSMAVFLEAMGMELFNYADPTGFDEEGVAWMDTNALLARWNMVNGFTTNRLNSTTPAVNMQALYQRYGWGGYVDILDFFEDITTHGAEPAGSRAIMESWLTSDAPGSFIINDDSLDNRIRQTLGLYLRMPEFNKQ